MIELVVAIVLLGILAAVVVPRVGGGSGFDERGLRDQTQAALRYAQKSAIAARRTACAIFSTAATPHRVSLRIASAFGAADCSTGSALLLPDGASEPLYRPENMGGVPALPFRAKGSIGMVHSLGNPDDGSSEFFILLNDVQPGSKLQTQARRRADAAAQP